MDKIEPNDNVLLGTNERGEDTITFRVQDLITYGVLGYDGNEFMAAISGYGLNIAFNMKLINSLADAEAMADSMANEYPEIVRFVRSTENVTIIRPELTVRQVLEKHGFPLISKEQAHSIRQAKTTKSEKLLRIRLHGTDKSREWLSGKIADKWQYLIAEPFMISERCCDCLKKKPLARYQKQTGEVPIIGTMADESRLRSQQYIRRGGCNLFSETSTASYPLSIWTDEDIWAYIRMFDVPYCELYDKGLSRTGCMVCGFGAQYETENSRFELLHRMHPKAYRIFMDYTNNGVTYREALTKVGVRLPE